MQKERFSDQPHTFQSANYANRKYRALELINAQDYDTAKYLKRNLPALLGITRQTFWDWLNADLADRREMPATKLLLLAQILCVRPEELLNFQLKPAVPIQVQPTRRQVATAIAGLME